MVLMMEKNMKKLVLAISLLLVAEGLFAQRNLLRYADIEYELKRFEHAGAQYEEAFSLKQTYYSAKRAAESFTFIKSYQKAFEWWGKTITFNESDRADYLSYARSAVQAGKSLSELGIQIHENEKPLVYSGVVVPEDETIVFRKLEKYNGSGSDYGLVQDLAGRNYFVSDRGITDRTVKKPLRLDMRRRFSGQDRYRMNDRGFHRIYRDHVDMISEVDIDLEGVYHLSMPSFYQNKGQNEVVFTAVLRDRQGRKNKSHDVFPGIYRAQVDANGKFGRVEGLSFNKLSQYSVMHGFVFGERLYFSSDMPGGFGGFDLYFAEIKDGGFGPAVNLGPKVNGPSNEVFPYIFDNSLYFSSDRTSGLGGLDIYTIDAGLISELKNMGKPFNSPQDDFAFFVDNTGLQYISSDRGMSESRDDIYSIAYLLDRYRLRVFAENGERLDGMEDLYFKLIGPDGTEIPLKLEDGRIGSLREGDYFVEIQRKGFFPTRVPLKALVPDGKEKVVDYKLVPIPYGKMLAIDTVYYDLDRYNIRPDAAEVLDKAYALLNEFPDFNLNITSHTDARASFAYNEKLSQNRSNSASSYLKGKGVAGERISQGWKGEIQPVNPCSDGVDCPESMHDKNRRSILSLELFPDRDFDYQLPPGLDHVESTEGLMEALSRMVKQKRLALEPDVLAEDVIYYHLDRYEIRKDAEQVLEFAEKLMKLYPFLKLEISSHTDARQTNMYNDRLSKNRSMSVFFHLRNKGIAAERMQISWFSEYLNAEPCPDGVDCTEEQHQRNRRSVLKLTVEKADRSKLPFDLSVGNLDFKQMLDRSEK